MKEGQKLLATVTAVDERGVDIEAGGRPGFVQPIEVDWSGRRRPSEVVRAGDRVEVLVYAVTAERFYASIKQAHPELDPWRDPSRIAVGSVHEGTVIAVVEWGLTIAIDDASVVAMLLDGSGPRLHSVGDRFAVEVVAVDQERRRLEVRWVGASRSRTT